MTPSQAIFSPDARWIWNDTDQRGYHYYLSVRKVFSVDEPDAPARLLATADACYQVWLNGTPVGHGPSKSAGGTRAVDCHDITGRLRKGHNQMEFLVLSVGVGTMTYCLGDAGLIFEIQSGTQRIVSDGSTLVRRDATRVRPTVRRWMLPGIEDVQANVSPDAWQAATVVSSSACLYRRRVPPPRREPVYPARCVYDDRVRLPGFSASFRLKPALVDGAEAQLAERFCTPATLRLVVIAERAQVLRFTPTLGAVTWTFREKEIFRGDGWNLWKAKPDAPQIRLRAGRNTLIGRHRDNHFEDISLAGFSRHSLTVEPLQVEREDGEIRQIPPWTEANPYDLASGAEPCSDGPVRRTIWDLGAVHNGWISFEADGQCDTALLLAFFEGMEDGVPPRFQWPSGCNNALMYHLREGRQNFESFFPYGVRYIAVHEIGGAIQVRNLRLLKATCTSTPRGHFHCSDPILNSIHKIASQCVESGTDDTLTDCPTYEQVNWNFDNRLASWALLLAGDNRDIIKNSILLFAEDPARKGLVASQTPSQWNAPIPNYAFHWIQWCWDYYWHTADKPFVQTVFPAVADGIRDALERIDSSGLFSWPSVWHFVEWGHGRDDDHAVNTAEQAGLYQALQAAEKLARVLGKPTLAYELAAKRLKTAINRHLLNPQTGFYADSRQEDGTLSPVSSQVTNALVATSGVTSVAWSRRLARQLAEGICPLLSFGSPYGLFYIIELLDRHGHGEAIFREIHHRWGDMVRAGDGTTWEHFEEFGHGDWPTRSRCHPFSAYVLKYFAKHLLGIEATQPGFAAVRVRPKAISKLTFCQGSIFTPRGVIAVEWHRKGSKRKTKISLPPGTEKV